MKWVSFVKDGRTGFGIVKNGGIVGAGANFASIRVALTAGELDALGRELSTRNPDIDPATVAFLPVIPDSDKVVAIGRNYASHVEELDAETPEAPRTFIKHMSALVGDGQPIVRPKVSECFDYEGELCAVIGKPCRHVSPEDALSYVAGYTLMMDGSIRDYQKHSVPAGKNFNRSSSLGPCFVTADEIPDPTALTLLTRLNGETVQQSTTDLLITDIPHYISYLSAWLEFLPGDVIASGTPGGVGQKRKPPLWMKPGDTIEVEIPEIGILRNPVIAE